MLEQYTDAQLKAELERRSNRLPKPDPIKRPDFSDVIRMCREYVDSLDTHGWVDDDLEHYIFEGAVTAVYGGDHVWKYIRSVK